MHKLIHGKSARHINGDRLDNRRGNLVDSLRGPPAKRNRSQEDSEEFFIKTPRVLTSELHSFKQGNKDLLSFTGYANIEYGKDKHFSGDIKLGKPEGYGHLYESKFHRHSCGLWEDGNMKRGMVIEYKPLPRCLCEIWKSCPLREVSKLDVVIDGLRR
jgi:hypothetical protein